LPQTHHLIRFLRALLDEVAPDVLLVTETNVPHADNISYFGDGHNEAQMVYNFTLPPLTLHTFLTGDAGKLTEWAQTLRTPSQETAFFNFMASHDGVGVRPVEGILTFDEVAALAQSVEAHGGYVSYRTNADGTQSPYELNIVYYDALNDPVADEEQTIQVNRFLCSQAILLSLAGVPGIYVHSLFGSRNWREGVAITGRNRSINRRKFRREELAAQLADPDSVPHQVFAGYRRLLEVRRWHAAFHPNGEQRVLAGEPSLFVLQRTAPDGIGSVLCLHNVTGQAVEYAVTAQMLGADRGSRIVDLLSERDWCADDQGNLSLTVPPYGVYWLAAA
jgi:glycosidase